jgi:Ca-activated chloride channel family protein
MSFGRPEFLWLLLASGLLGLWIRRGQRRRERSWRLLAQPGSAPSDGSAVIFVSILLLILALAQPRFGSGRIRPAEAGQDVLLLIDVSLSMAAEDAVPDRLAMAITAAESLVEELGSTPASRVGVVAFAGRGVLRCPLTENLGAVIEALRRLTPGSIRPGGTNLGAALEAALEAIGPVELEGNRTVVLFSDGEDHEGTWPRWIEPLRRRGVMVHTVAIGDSEGGHPIPTGPDRQPMKHRGDVVLTRRIDTALAEIAQQTDGAFVPAGRATLDLGRLYQDRIAPVASRRREERRLPDLPERFPLFLAAAVVLVVAGCWPTGRGRRACLPAPPRLSAAAAIALIAAGASPVPEPNQNRSVAGLEPAIRHVFRSLFGETTQMLVERGRNAYRAGNFAEALESFEAAAARDPAEPILDYNIAASLFQLGRYAEARQRYLSARGRANEALRIKIDYALGNATLLVGDAEAALRHYDDCLAATTPGTELDQIRRDAAINRQVAIARSRATQEPQDPRSPSQSGQRRQAEGLPQADSDGHPPDGESDEQGGGDEAPTRAAGANSAEGRLESGRRVSQAGGGGGGGGGRSAGDRRARPEELLDAAIERIRESRQRRLPEALDLGDLPPGVSGKLW